jgi:hypothetical protein
MSETIYAACGRLFVGIVLVGVMPARLFHVFRRMHQVPVGDHGVMGGFLKLARSVMLGRHSMMLGGMLQEFRGF